MCVAVAAGEVVFAVVVEVRTGDVVAVAVAVVAVAVLAE